MLCVLFRWRVMCIRVAALFGLVHDFMDCHLPCCCCCWLCVPKCPSQVGVCVAQGLLCTSLCVLQPLSLLPRGAPWLGGVRCCSTHVQRAQSASLPMSTPVYVVVLVIELYVAGICLCARLESSREAERESGSAAAAGTRSLPRILWAHTPYTYDTNYTMFGCFDAKDGKTWCERRSATPVLQCHSHTHIHKPRTYSPHTPKLRADTMLLFVKLLTGRMLNVDVEPAETVADLKAKITAKTDIPVGACIVCCMFFARVALH